MSKKNVRMVTPKGKAMWAKVLKPDTKFNPEGIYSLDFIIDMKDATELVEAISSEVQKQYEIVADDLRTKGKGSEVRKIKYADNPFVEVYDDQGNPSGEYKFKFKLKATGKSKDGSSFSQKPILFDAEGKEVSVEIWNGSVVKVAFELVPFYTSLIGVGVSLRLKAVQIIELVSSQSSGSNAFGFKKEEGFVSSQVVENKEPLEEIDDDIFGDNYR